MGTFGCLSRKELRQNGPTALAFAAVMAAWDLFLYNFTGRWPDHAVMALFILPMGFLPFWSLWRMIQTLRGEWAGNHTHLLLALPVPGWHLTVTKMLGLLLELTLYGLVPVVGGFYLVAVRGGIVATDDPFVLQTVQAALLLTVPLVLPHIVVCFAAVYAGVQFAWLASRLVTRAQWAVAALSMIGVGWLLLRGSWLAGRVLAWLPRVPVGQTVTTVDVTGDGIPELVSHLETVQPGPMVGAFIIMVGLLAAASWVLEREVEI
ncbi:MAG TPA: hypothetical protein VF282_10775 [Bacillota bacterium]